MGASPHGRTRPRRPRRGTAITASPWSKNHVGPRGDERTITDGQRGRLRSGGRCWRRRRRTANGLLALSDGGGTGHDLAELLGDHSLTGLPDAEMAQVTSRLILSPPDPLFSRDSSPRPPPLALSLTHPTFPQSSLSLCLCLPSESHLVRLGKVRKERGLKYSSYLLRLLLSALHSIPPRSLSPPPLPYPNPRPPS
jgi:hypothetical protein